MSEMIAAEDLVEGQVIELGSRKVTGNEIVDFARQWDPQWFHTDTDAAARGHHGGVIASGIHTLAILQRLCVEAFYARWAVIAGRGFDTLRFTAPVHADDTLTGSVSIDRVSLDDRRGRVVMGMEMRNQHGAPVLAATMTVYLWRRAHIPDGQLTPGSLPPAPSA